MGLLFDQVIPLLGLYPKNPETIMQKNLCTPVFIEVFTKAKCWKQPRCPSANEWIKKLWYIDSSGQDGGVGRNALLPPQPKEG